MLERRKRAPNCWTVRVEAQSGEELLSALLRLSTERVLQGVLEQEQTEALGAGAVTSGRRPRRGLAMAMKRVP